MTAVTGKIECKNHEMYEEFNGTPKPSTCPVNLSGSQLYCVDTRNYNQPYVVKGEIVYNDKWNTLKTNIDTEYVRRCKQFKGVKDKDDKVAFVKSNYYKHKYFEELKRKVGDLVTASSFNSLAQIINDLGLECACNCAYCTCNCNYCLCNNDFCTCACNYCTCNGVY